MYKTACDGHDRLGLMLSLLMVLAGGCVSYHGPTKTTTSTEVVTLSKNAQSEISAKVDGDIALEVTVMVATVVEKAEIEKTKKHYRKHSYEGGQLEVLFAPLFMIFDLLRGPREEDEPYVPVLSRVSCVLPLFHCRGKRGGGGDVESESESVMRRWTDTDRTPMSARVKVEGAGQSLDIRTDSAGHVRVPLRDVALTALLAGNEQATLRVSLVK